MLQILPYIQSPLEQLTPYISQAAGSIGSAIGKNARNKADQSILAQLQSGEVSPANYPTLWGKLSKEAREINEPFLQSAIRQQESTKKEELKRESADIEKGERSTSVIETADELKDLLPYTGSTGIPFTSSFNAKPGGLNRKGLEQRNKFDTLAAGAASFFRDLDTKGQLPQGLYEQVIKPRIPNSELSEAENRGRIEGLIELAKKYGGKGFKKGAPKGEEKAAEKVKAGTKLTKDIVQKWKSEGLTQEQSEKRAKELGYEF